MSKDKFKVEIWSDVMCPFCYIGKRKFELALKDFDSADSIDVEWKSFQLNPNLTSNPQKSLNEYLAEIKGISLEKAKQMNDYVTNMAAQVGLVYNLDKAIVANSFDAHRFAHFMKSKGKQLEAEEALFKAYFTEGKNTSDFSTLGQLGADLGVAEAETVEMLQSDRYREDVETDVYQAQQLGINAVPFFVLNRRYGVSGAQDPAVFLKALKQSFEEWTNSPKDVHQ